MKEQPRPAGSLMLAGRRTHGVVTSSRFWVTTPSFPALRKESSFELNQNMKRCLAKAAMGERIRKLREARGLSQADLAALCQLNRQHLGQIELGRQNPTLETMLVIAQRLEASPSRLFGAIPAVDFSPNPERLIQLEGKTRMLDPQITLAKEEVYQSLAVINASIKLTVEHLEKLKAGLVTPDHLTDIICALFRQKQAEIGFQVTTTMNSHESADSSRFETEWLAMEGKLKQMDEQAAAEADDELGTELTRKVGARIRELREEKGWSEEQFAQECDIDPGLVANLEKGYRAIDIDLMATITAALQVPIERWFKAPDSGPQREEQLKPREEQAAAEARAKGGQDERKERTAGSGPV